LQTSGSTGNPKIISADKKFLESSAAMTVSYFGLKTGDHILLNLPVKFIAGKMMLIRAMFAGLNVTMIPPGSNPLEDQAINRYAFGAMVPAQVYHSIESENTEKLEAIDKLIIGGGDVSAPLLRMIRSLRNEVYATYGMTETYSHIAVRKLNPIAEESFTLLTGVKAWYDERNCLVIDAPMLGVHQMPTNDIVEFTDLRKFKWIGRYDYIINSGGIKISPEVIEKKIGPYLNRRFFIAGIPDSKWGERVVIIIEGEPFDPYTDQLFRSHLANSLEKNMIPRDIYFLPSFEETPTGKIKRRETKNLILKN
jgi:o-succinylbenzoate---CoA ligase